MLRLLQYFPSHKTSQLFYEEVIRKKNYLHNNDFNKATAINKHIDFGLRSKKSEEWKVMY